MSGQPTSELRLCADERVQVRSKEEILATLDANGRLDEMPFMEEMLRHCGKILQVSKRAHKTCDPAIGIVGRTMNATVHLENLRCDGSKHDGCQADCLIFWKEAWLKRLEPSADNTQTPALQRVSSPASQCSEETLRACSKIPPRMGESEPSYVCQNTQVKHASRPLKWWDARQYVEDYASGNVRLWQLVAGGIFTIWRTITDAGVGLGSGMRWTYDTFQRAIGGSPYPMRYYGVPKGVATPKALLDLQVGERVRVKPYSEIIKTLDHRYRNRGLYFDPDYVPFTEREFRVVRRVKQIIDERTCKMIRFTSDAIVLENVYCEARYAYCRRFCPRAIVPYWREIWLERVSDRATKTGVPQQPIVSSDQ